jgi:hypothetical protein
MDDVAIELPGRPGSLARFGEALGAAGVSLEGGGVFTVIRRLKQGVPGQLGAISRALTDAGVNIETQYSDHANRLILVIDDLETADRATRDWAA